MKLLKRSLPLLSAVLMASMVSACAAQYQTIRNKDAGKNSSSDGKPKKDSNGPVAGVEVIYKDKVVTKVPVGEPFVIRPTESTLDGDDAGKKDCPNPGIMKADYQIGEASKDRARLEDLCSDLSISFEIDKEGEVKITLLVETDEKETAEAETVITVVKPEDMPKDLVGDDDDDDNGSTGGNTGAGDDDDDDDDDSGSTGGSSSTTGDDDDDDDDNGGGGSSSTTGDDDDDDDDNGGGNPGQHPGQSPHQGPTK